MIARVLLALIFVWPGASKFAGLGGTAGYIASEGCRADALAFGTGRSN